MSGAGVSPELCYEFEDAWQPPTGGWQLLPTEATREHLHMSHGNKL